MGKPCHLVVHHPLQRPWQISPSRRQRGEPPWTFFPPSANSRSRSLPTWDTTYTFKLYIDNDSFKHRSICEQKHLHHTTKLNVDVARVFVSAFKIAFRWLNC